MFNFRIIISVSFLIGWSLAAPTASKKYDTPDEALDEVNRLLQKIGAVLINFPEVPPSDEKSALKKAKQANQVFRGLLDLLNYEYPSLNNVDIKLDKNYHLLQRLEETADKTDDFLYKRTTTTERSTRDKVKGILGIVAQALSAAG